MRTHRKMQQRVVVVLVLATLSVFSNGCVGLSHSSDVCCRHVPGKYYRATRVDIRLMGKNPWFTPVIVATDLPFALVLETLEVPFIAIGLVDPRPPSFDGNESQADQIGISSRVKIADPPCERALRAIRIPCVGWPQPVPIPDAAEFLQEALVQQKSTIRVVVTPAASSQSVTNDWPVMQGAIVTALDYCEMLAANPHVGIVIENQRIVIYYDE